MVRSMKKGQWKAFFRFVLIVWFLAFCIPASAGAEKKPDADKGTKAEQSVEPEKSIEPGESTDPEESMEPEESIEPKGSMEPEKSMEPAGSEEVTLKPAVKKTVEDTGKKAGKVPAFPKWLFGVLGAVLLVLLICVILLVNRHHKKGKEGEEIVHSAPVPDHTPYSRLQIGKVHNIGRRSSQQDSFGLSMDGEVLKTEGRGILAVVADGMGGMENGGQISALVTMTMLQQFDSRTSDEEGDKLLLELANKANEEVNVLQANAGGKRGGSTLVTVFVKEDEMYWLTIGDSHLYLYRNDALLQVNQDHVYAVELDEKAARGEISSEEAVNDPQRKALTSYIGAGTIRKIDRNIRPVKLRQGDRILMMSDGVFGTLSDEEIAAAMRLPVGESSVALDQMIQNKNKETQDNYTALIMEYLWE